MEIKKLVQVHARMTKAKKQKFREACETQGKTISQAIEEFIEAFIDDVSVDPTGA